MKILQVIAHPAPQSYTRQLAEAFRHGAAEVGNDVRMIEAYNPNHTIDGLQSLIRVADHINFAFPLWWEMPPATLVDILQTVFVRGFAFQHTPEGREVLLDKKASCIISMGQNKDFNESNLADAMLYCGLDPDFLVFNGVGPDLSELLSDTYLETAYQYGKSLKDHNGTS